MSDSGSVFAELKIFNYSEKVVDAEPADLVLLSPNKRSYFMQCYPHF